MNLIVTNWVTYLSLTGIVILCVFLPFIGKISEWFITIIHEVGHGFTALVLGGGIQGIKLHADGSGSTQTYQSVGLFSKTISRIVLFAGYSFPIYLGTGLLVTVFSNNYIYGFIALIVVGVITLVFLRNLFGFFIITLYFGSIFIVWAMRNSIDTSYLVFFLGMLFIIRGFYDLIAVGRMVFNENNTAESDFHLLAAQSWLSAKVWYVLYLIIQVVLVAGVLSVAGITFSFA